MPRYKGKTEKQRARHLIKPILENNLNQTKTARQLGLTPQTINEQFHKPAVQSALDAALAKEGITIGYKAKKFKKLLDAVKIQDCDIFIKDEKGKLKINKNSNDFIEVEDNIVQLGTLRLLCQVQGDIKTNGNNKGVNVSTIIINIKSGDKLLSPAEADYISHSRG